MLQAQRKVPRADAASSLRASGTVTRIRPMSRGGCSPRRTGSLPVSRQCSGWSVVAVPACGAVVPRRAGAQGTGVAGGRGGGGGGRGGGDEWRAGGGGAGGRGDREVDRDGDHVALPGVLAGRPEL